MGYRRYSAASRLEVLLDEDDFRSFLQALELGDVLLLLQLRVTVLVLWNQFCVPLFDPPCRVPPTCLIIFNMLELEGKEFLVLTGQYSIEIFSCCLRLLAFCSSTFHQTNIESTQICSDDHLSVSKNSIAPSSSRGNSPCRRRVFILSATGYAWSNWAPGSISIHVLSRIWKVLDDEQEVEGLLGFAVALHRLANANTSVFVVEVSCSLSSYSLSVKSVTNLFRPMRNSDPRVRIAFVHIFNSDLHSVILFCQFVLLYALLLCPANCEFVIRDKLGSLRKRSWIPLKRPPTIFHDFTGHSRSDWCFQLLTWVLDGFFEFRILGVDVMDPSQFSCVFKVELFLRPFLLLLQLGVLSHWFPEFWP